MPEQHDTPDTHAALARCASAQAAEEDDWEEEEDDGNVGLADLLDAEGRMRVQRQRCGTCIGWDENRMHLAEGRREAMRDAAVAEDSFIPCHQTLPYAQYDAPPAVCHWYWLQARDQSWPMRWARMQDAVAEVDPPSLDWEGGPCAQQ